MLKIGFTTRTPEHRAKEMAGTHSPLPYKVEYKLYCPLAKDSERAVHRIIQHTRIGKEWFNCSLLSAIEAIQRVGGPEAVAKQLAQLEERRQERVEAEKTRRQEEELRIEHQAAAEAERQALVAKRLSVPIWQKLAYSTRNWLAGDVAATIGIAALCVCVGGLLLWRFPKLWWLVILLALGSLSKGHWDTLGALWFMFWIVIVLIWIGYSVWNYLF